MQWYINMRPKLITQEQERKLVSLYNEGLPIKQIMTETGIKSEQTIYRLLRENDIPKRSVVKSKKITFSASPDVVKLLSGINDPSAVINEAVVAYMKNGLE